MNLKMTRFLEIRSEVMEFSAYKHKGLIASSQR